MHSLGTNLFYSVNAFETNSFAIESDQKLIKSSLKYEFEEIVDVREFYCAISKKMMQKPMLLACGHNFEEESLLQWFEYIKDRVCYICEMSVHSLIPNIFLKNVIEKWQAHQESDAESSNSTLNLIIKEEDLACSLSKKRMRIPVSLACGHVFDDQEIKKRFTQEKHKVCVICHEDNQVTRFNPFVSHVIKNWENAMNRFSLTFENQIQEQHVSIENRSEYSEANIENVSKDQTLNPIKEKHSTLDFQYVIQLIKDKNLKEFKKIPNFSGVDKEENTFLHHIVLNRCSVKFTEVFGKKKGDINHRNKSGQTALHLAALVDDFRMYKKLIAQGAKDDIKDLQGQKALDLATNKLKRRYFNSKIDS